MHRPLALALVVLTAAAATADDKKPADELKTFVGKWKLRKAEIGGKDFFEHLKAIDFKIHDGGKYTVKFGEEMDVGTFSVDPSKSPKQMDITSTGGPNKGKVIPAIYKLEGDTLTTVYELGGGPRPTAFESKPGTMQFLAVYQRQR